MQGWLRSSHPPSVASITLIRVRGGGGWDLGGFSWGFVVLLGLFFVVFFFKDAQLFPRHLFELSRYAGVPGSWELDIVCISAVL